MIKAVVFALVLYSSAVLRVDGNNGCEVISGGASCSGPIGNGNECPSGKVSVASYRQSGNCYSFQRQLCCPVTLETSYRIGRTGCTVNGGVDFEIPDSSDVKDIVEACPSPWTTGILRSCSGGSKIVRECTYTASPTKAPTCYVNDRVEENSCDECKFPYGTTPGKEKCSTCLCKNGGSCAPASGNGFKCVCANSNYDSSGLCTECRTDGFDFATGCEKCKVNKAGPNCLQSTQCVNGEPRVDGDFGCKANTCTTLWPGVDVANAWVYTGANCDQRPKASNSVLALCELVLSSVLDGSRNDPAYCAAQSASAGGLDALQGTLVACAEAFFRDGQTPKAKSALEVTHQCLFEQASGFAQPKRLLVVERIGALLSYYSQVELESIGLGPAGQEHGLRMSIDAITSILSSTPGKILDLARVCKYLCPCDTYSSLATSGGVCDIQIADNDFQKALELQRLQAGFCADWVETNLPGAFINSAHLANSLFCTRDRALGATSDDQLRHASDVLNEIGVAAQSVIDIAAGQGSTDAFLADRVLRAYGRTLAADRDYSDAHVAVGNMPLFTAATLNKVAPGTTGNTLELAQKFVNMGAHLAEMEQNDFQFKQTFDASAESLDRFMTSAAELLATSFSEEFQFTAAALDLEASVLENAFDDISTTIQDSFERAKVLAIGFPERLESLVNIVTWAMETAQQVVDLEAAIARTKAIGNIVFSLVTSGFDFFNAFRFNNLAGLTGNAFDDLLVENLRGFYLFRGLGTIASAGAIAGDWPSDLYPGVAPLNDTDNQLGKLLIELDATLSQTLQRWGDVLQMVKRTQAKESVRTVLLNATLTPASSSAVWMSIYREIMYLLKFEFNICPLPALDTQFDAVIEKGRRRRLEERRRSPGTQPKSLRRSLNDKKQLAEARQELGSLVDDLIDGCEKFDIDMRSFAEFGEAFQNGIDAFVTHTFSYLVALGQKELAEAAPGKIESALVKVAQQASAANPWPSASIRAQQFAEMYRAVISTDVILLEQQAKRAIHQLCQAYRYADPRPRQQTNSLVSAGPHVQVDPTTCKVHLLPLVTDSLSFRVKVLGDALEDLASSWYLQYLDNYAGAPTQTSKIGCSVVDPYFFATLFADPSTTPLTTFHVNFDSFKNFCQTNTELLNMWIVLFDQDGNVLPRPGAGTGVQPTFSIKARSAFQKYTQNTTTGGVNAPHQFTATRDFQFTSAYTVPSLQGGCSSGDLLYVGPDAGQRVCGTFQPSHSFGNLFIRPAPYTTWQVSLVSGSIAQLGGTPARAQVFFNVASQTPESPQELCDGFGALKPPPAVFQETGNPFGASLGSTCQWKYTKANRANVPLNPSTLPTTPPSPAPAPEPQLADWVPLTAGGLGGLAVLVLATIATIKARKKKNMMEGKIVSSLPKQVVNPKASPEL